jgi:integrase
MPKRRANGEGNIRKRKDGRWEGRYTAGYDPETGKRIIKNVLGKTQAEVKEKLKTAISESQKLDVSKAGTYTVSSWVRTWYEVYAEPRIRPNTKAYYTNYIENHIIPGIGNISLDKLTTIQIQRFYNNLQKSGRVQRKNFPELKDKSLSPRVVRGVHTLLRNCLEQAVAERLLLTNPAQGCKLPQLEKKEMKILPQEKIGLYLAEAEKRGLLAAFYLELTTGLRRGELLALQWTDLDVESKTLSITKQVNRINGELAVSPPKTRNSIRTLALPQQAVDLLIAEHKKHPCNLYLFPSPKTGTMYDPDAFRRTHDKILKAIGAEHIRFHDLRHTFATLSLKSGVDVKTLSGALGHYSAGFTLNTYTHATAQMKQDAADTIGGVIKFIPSTGVTLPLVSYGGSSLLSTMIVFGIIQGLYIMQFDGRTQKKEQKRRRGRKE